MTDASPHQAVEAVVRTAYGRLVAYLASITGDLAAAEDAFSDAVVSALRTWPEHGVPERPDAWLLTAARRGLVDAARRRDTVRRNLPEIARAIDERAATPDPDDHFPDTRLGLLFACAHPGIDPAVRSPLMLQAVLGLDAARIGSAFLVAPATMGQRLVRAKAKIKAARIPFAVPDPAELPDRLGAVLDAVYAAYGTGWDTSTTGPGLTAEALRLARLVVELMPAEPEAHGLLALLLHSHARTAARRDDAGRYVPLERQDTGRWSGAAIAEAETHLRLALAQRRPGPYQLHAAIQSVHNLRAATGATDWPAIAGLYDGLVFYAPTTGALVARAAAVARARTAAAGLALLDQLPPDGVAGYQPYWATRADLLRRVGRPAEAAAATDRAIGLTEDPAVRDFLREQAHSPR